jgi:hypothetical protein
MYMCVCVQSSYIHVYTCVTLQGIIHNTRMALSGMGRQADVDLVTNLYEEVWWLDFLASGNLSSM